MSENDINPDTVDVDPKVAELFHAGRASTAIVEERDEIPSADEFLVELLKLHGEQLADDDDSAEFALRGFQ